MDWATIITYVLSTLFGGGCAYGAIKTHIRFLWRDIGRMDKRFDDHLVSEEEKWQQVRKQMAHLKRAIDSRKAVE